MVPGIPALWSLLSIVGNQSIGWTLCTFPVLGPRRVVLFAENSGHGPEGEVEVANTSI